MARLAPATDPPDIRLVATTEKPGLSRTVRFTVTWFDEEEKRLLLSERANARFFTDVEDWEIREQVRFRDFGDAISFAKDRLEDATTGEVRIERHLRVRSKVVADRWETDAIWLLDSPAITPKEELPDERPDIDLDEDDDILD